MPQPRKPQGYGEYYCKPCNVRFHSHERLMIHKKSKRENGSPNHIHCKFCGADFATEEIEIEHIQQYHPQAQELECPGCGYGPFPRVSSLILHIESGECARVDMKSIETHREKKLEFPAKLAALTGETLKGNYTDYMPSSEATKYKEEDVWDVEEKYQIIPFADDAFPQLPGKAPEAKKIPKEEVAVWEPTDGNDADEHEKAAAWTKKENLFPNAPDVKRPTMEELETATKPNPRDEQSFLDIDDPSHPQFNVARYYCKYHGKFVCPKLRCIKVFKKAGGLISHLNSPAHGDKTYTCPSCCKRFKSLTAVTAHSESASLKCNMRDTHGYGAYMDQLTGGIIDVDLLRHDDGTVKYTTTKSAYEAYGNSRDAQKVPGAEEDANVEKNPLDQELFW